MTSKLKAIGRCAREGEYAVSFYYGFEKGGRDTSMPTWEVPAQSWSHMQNIVTAFNNTERASDMAALLDLEGF